MKHISDDKCHIQLYPNKILTDKIKDLAEKEGISISTYTEIILNNYFNIPDNRLELIRKIKKNLKNIFLV